MNSPTQMNIPSFYYTYFLLFSIHHSQRHKGLPFHNTISNDVFEQQ